MAVVRGLKGVLRCRRRSSSRSGWRGTCGLSADAKPWGTGGSPRRSRPAHSSSSSSAWFIALVIGWSERGALWRSSPASPTTIVDSERQRSLSAALSCLWPSRRRHSEPRGMKVGRRKGQKDLRHVAFTSPTARVLSTDGVQAKAQLKQASTARFNKGVMDGPISQQDHALQAASIHMILRYSAAPTKASEQNQLPSNGWVARFGT